ncbi:hypothetical protein P171DRAFT_431005 [Karstenula rhodostoma CBS 690.94]|uniref:Uncharacterized protein n=1 Tax=Karstenula rhodostoma CBS 690.94 TaxID=1392251 RepID=A0A9P4UCU8_9PLEO|nr:hypothetical protein P171DRAFT_431005 [Karstenula rhodostoma CBS 690.94]
MVDVPVCSSIANVGGNVEVPEKQKSNVCKLPVIHTLVSIRETRSDLGVSIVWIKVTGETKQESCVRLFITHGSPNAAGMVFGWLFETVREGWLNGDQTWTLDARERDVMSTLAGGASSSRRGRSSGYDGAALEGRNMSWRRAVQWSRECRQPHGQGSLRRRDARYRRRRDAT